MSVERPVLEHLTRRSTLTGVVTVGIGLPLLAACGGEDAATGAATTSGSESGSGSAASPAAGAESSSAAGGSDAITSTADIEVGGGKIFADDEIVITQPTAGEFKCFTAVCTHTGCLVAEVSDGTIDCPCHGSKYSIADGSVQSGPAPAPLEEKSITVAGDQISLA